MTFNAEARAPTVVLQTRRALNEDWSTSVAERVGHHAINRLSLALNELHGRQEDWDGFGSAAPNREALSRAIQAGRSLVAQSLKAGLSWFDPMVGSDEDGNVSMEWWRGRQKLTLYFSPEATEYVLSWGKNIDSEMDSGTLAQDFSALWQRLHQPVFS